MADHQDKVNEEVQRLVKEFIPRLGSMQEDGRFGVSYGTLFDDDEGQQFFEAIMGTLKAARRQNLIDFKGQMLLKGAHDKTIIYLVPQEAAVDGATATPPEEQNATGSA